MARSIVFDPLLPDWAIVLLAVLALAGVALALWRGLPGWWLRGLAGAAIVAALANPALKEELRDPLSDIVLAVVDESASQGLSDRAAQSAEALAELQAAVEGLPGTELRVTRLGDAPEGSDGGTRLMGALGDALAEVPRARVAGAVLITDGQVHDAELAPDLPAPLHALLTGRADDWDRRIAVEDAPAFAIIGEEVRLRLRVEDMGAAPVSPDGRVDLAVAIDGGEEMLFRVPIGQGMEVPLTLSHGGANVIRFRVPVQEGELTARNNTAVVSINGVRDRLRVLLVSGEPHAGERTWRNLLKADPAVDLVHFTILRPPMKQDGVPVDELSLIAFPTRELFLDKIEDFDLIIFDRYRLRGILPSLYLDNVRRYIEDGGAVLISAGPEFAGADSLWHSPLAQVMPGRPTARVIERGFLPRVAGVGVRHPVTSGLTGVVADPEAEDDTPDWGRWLRQIELTATAGQTVMTGFEGSPLLLLDRVGEGRVALLGSDHAWLWDRGFEGGGPQLELLRRLAHWMMKEPELEEESLRAEARGQALTITRRTLAEGARSVTLTAPSGEEREIALEQQAPGRHVARVEVDEQGLYRLADETASAVVAVGPAAPREYAATIATDALLGPLANATRGGVMRLVDGFPQLRQVAEGRPAAGRGWIGITPRDAYVTMDVRISPLLPAWAALLLLAGLVLAAWLREGRRAG